jgi:pimeloyl-ACP methyl ester carboxylesterase
MLDGYNLVSIAQRIECPVLLLQAEPNCGGMFTDYESERFAGTARDCRLVRVTGAGHTSHASHPQLLMDQTDRFLAAIAQ